MGGEVCAVIRAEIGSTLVSGDGLLPVFRHSPAVPETAAIVDPGIRMPAKRHFMKRSRHCFATSCGLMSCLDCLEQGQRRSIKLIVTRRATGFGQQLGIVSVTEFMTSSCPVCAKSACLEAETTTSQIARRQMVRTLILLRMPPSARFERPKSLHGLCDLVLSRRSLDPGSKLAFDRADRNNLLHVGSYEFR